jgi:RNA polymerase sigma factor (sigma-70 family)
VGDFDYASDVLQDAFVRIFTHLHTFRKESTLGAWIKTIVIRTAYGHLRKQKMLIEPLDQIQQEAVTIWPDFLQAEHLEKAIVRLPEGYRLVFVLIEVEGYSHKDVATLLNISEGTSKSQLFHAKKTLRAMLNE